MVTVGTAPMTIIEANKKRVLLTITNDHSSAIVYLDNKAQPSTTRAKWILYPYETLIFDLKTDHPERALFGVSDTASTNVVLGFQNEEK